MTQKEITERMAACTYNLKRGIISIYECEQSMNNVIMDGVLEMLADTAEQNDRRIAAIKKLKRRMWRMLLEATKKQGVD